jgi:hypothetical protein
MLNNLLVVTAVVILLWLIILAIFLIVSRQQPDVQAQMRSLDERLSETERESGKQ